MSVSKKATNSALTAKDNATLLAQMKVIIHEQIVALRELAEHDANEIEADDKIREKMDAIGGRRAWEIYVAQHPDIEDRDEELDTEYHRIHTVINALEPILEFTETDRLSLSQYKHLDEKIKLLSGTPKSELEKMLALELIRSPELRTEFETRALEEMELARKQEEQIKLDHEHTRNEATSFLKQIIKNEEPLINSWTFFGYSPAQKIDAAKELLKHLDKDNQLSMSDLISFADKNSAIYKMSELKKIFEFIGYDIYKQPRSQYVEPDEDLSPPQGLG